MGEKTLELLMEKYDLHEPLSVLQEELVRRGMVINYSTETGWSLDPAPLPGQSMWTIYEYNDPGDLHMVEEQQQKALLGFRAIAEDEVQSQGILSEYIPLRCSSYYDDSLSEGLYEVSADTGPLEDCFSTLRISIPQTPENDTDVQAIVDALRRIAARLKS